MQTGPSRGIFYLDTKKLTQTDVLEFISFFGGPLLLRGLF